MSKMFLLPLSFMLLAFARADHPITILDIEELPIAYENQNRNADEIYRLPGNVVPREYDVYIDMYFAERQDRPFSFDGKVYTKIQVWLYDVLFSLS